jgi:uncharacterized protein YndB with AHSA1/START domain
MTPDLVVRHTMPIARERVFDAWLDPVRLARFMRSGPITRATAEVDPRVGGKFRIVMFHPNSGPQGTEHAGEYLLIDRPRQLVFTWRSVNTDDRPTTVTIDFLEIEGGTEIVLTHRQLPPQQIDGHRKGWSAIVEALEKAA